MHHHHHPGVAVAAGVAIGAAASKRHQKQQQQNVVVVQPVYPNGYSSTSTSYTATYVPAPPPVAPAVVVAAPKKRRKSLVVCVFCVFFVTIILCVSLIPWPGYMNRTVISGSQTLDYVDGNFVEYVNFTGTINAEPMMYAFTERPPLSDILQINVALSFAPSYQDRNVEVHFDLHSGSSVYYSWIYNDSCTLQFAIIRGQSRYESFLQGASVSSSILPIDVTGNFNGATFRVDVTDRYYFIFVNPGTACVPSKPGRALFEAESLVYDTSTAVYVCQSSPCQDFVPYGHGRYYMLAGPVTDSIKTYGGSYFIKGRWYAYTSLYVGLSLGMCVCMVFAAYLSKRKDEKSNEEEQSLLRAPEAMPVAVQTVSSYNTNSNYQSTLPAFQPQAPSAPMPSDEPPAYNQYAIKYDPMTGQPITQT